MANIATLAVSITANTDKFIKGINKATAELQAFAATSAKYATVAAGAAATGLALLVKESLANIDATAKLADRLGFTTEQFTGLQHAADLAGVKSDSMRIGFEKLLKTLKPGQDPAVEIMRIADQVKAIKDPAERAQFAMEKFGRSGQELIPLLAGGSEALRKMAEENERLGGSFSRIDAAKVEAANDAVSKLWQVIKGVGNTLAIELAPFIKAAADGLVAMASAGDGIKANTKSAFDSIVLGIAKSLDYLDYFKSGWYSLESIINEVAAFVVDAFGEAFNIFADMIDFNFIAPLRRINDAVPTKALTNLINGFDAATSKGTRLFKDMSANITEDAEKAAKLATKAYGNFLNGTNSQNAIQGLRNLQIEQEKIAKQSADAAAAANAPRGTFGEYVDLEALKNKRAMGETAKEADKARQELESWATKMSEAIRTPLEVFNDEMAKASEALKKHLFDPEDAKRNTELYQAAVEKLVKDRNAALLGRVDIQAAENKAGEIKQFDLSRINVRGLSHSKRQEVEAPKMEKNQEQTNKILSAIGASLGGIGELGTFGT